MSRPRRTVTALFDDADTVDRALDSLYSVGTPRDLVEVVVSRDAAERFYAVGGGKGQGPRRRTPKAPGRETFRYAGIGALVGFGVGMAISLVNVMWPGLDAPGGMSLVQLLGPNVGTIGGAAVGALLGLTRRQAPDPRHARAAEASGAIVLAVSAYGDDELPMLERILTDSGGHDVRIEQYESAGTRAA